MPARLPDTSTRWTGRLWADDLALLKALYPHKTNEVIRDLLHAACERKREELRAKFGEGHPLLG